MLDLKTINTDWTLFLDRDGVINRDKVGDYVYNVEEFVFCEGALEALRYFNKQFRRIVVVTNQKGVGKGLMTVDDLNSIHQYMMFQVQSAGGRIDHIYYCTALDNNDPNRKPNPGMAFQAYQDFPDIAPSRSLVAGNNLTDMEFGRNAGCRTLFIRSTLPDLPLPHPAIDLAMDSLADLAKALQDR